MRMKDAQVTIVVEGKEYVPIVQAVLQGVLQEMKVDWGHVSNFPENYFTLWKDGRMEGWKRAVFQSSILPSFHSQKV